LGSSSWLRVTAEQLTVTLSRHGRGAAACQVGAGVAQHPQVEVDDQAVGFGNADETVGPSRPCWGCCQRTRASSLATRPAQVEDRLVMHAQAALFEQRQAQLFFQLQGNRGAGLQAVVEKIQAVAPVVLGLVQRQVGMLEQFFGAAAVVRKMLMPMLVVMTMRRPPGRWALSCVA
jgi:hypothetical protein